MMLEFRQAAGANNLPELQRLSLLNDFDIDAAGPKSKKTAAHVAAERANFLAIYWLYDKGADFYCKDDIGKTAIDYLQEIEFSLVESRPMLKGPRKYTICNAHYKIWFAHDPSMFMPYLYQEDFRQYRERNPEGDISLVYSRVLLNEMAFSELTQFAEKLRMTLISFEQDLADLTEEFGTKEDKESYRWASFELKHYPNQGGGNLAVVSDLIRWNSVLLRIGNYSDTDVEIGQHQWKDSIATRRLFALNIGSFKHPHMIEPWMNGDIIAPVSLFPRALQQGSFKIVLSKAACFIIMKVQSALISSCQKNLEKRITEQNLFSQTIYDVSSYLRNYFRDPMNERKFALSNHFSAEAIRKIKEKGLDQFSSKEQADIIERMANLFRKKSEDKYETPEIAHKHCSVFQDVMPDEHEKFLQNCLLASQREYIKQSIILVSGVSAFAPFFASIFGSPSKGEWKKYSIYSIADLESAFRSKNTVRFDKTPEQHKRDALNNNLADLSFTPDGMKSVLRRSEELKAQHANNKV